MIEIKDLSYGINDDATEKEILKNVNLTLEDGKIYVITGPNGSGKSNSISTVAIAASMATCTMYLVFPILRIALVGLDVVVPAFISHSSFLCEEISLLCRL